MRPIYLILGLLFLCATVQSAADISGYLYENETLSSVTEQALNTGTGGYVLYSIGGKNAMILKDGVAVQDKSVIESLLKEHYSKEFLPSQTEWDAIKANITAFNASRNFKTQYGEVEKTCLQVTYMTDLPCTTYDKCYSTANVLCTNFASGGGGGGCYADQLAPMFLDYANQIIVLRENVPKLISLFDAISADNAGSRIVEMKTYITKVREAAKGESKSKLRYPETGDSCADCVGLCPSPHFDFTSLDAAEKSLDEINSRLGPLADLKKSSGAIATETADRTKYKTGTALLAVWEPKWSTFKGKYSTLYNNATSISSFVSDNSFFAVYDKFSMSWQSMDSRMESRDFESVETDMNTLQDNAPKLTVLVNETPKAFYSALEAKNNASDSIINARWNVRRDDPASVEAYNTLAKRQNTLNAKFVPPMTSKQYTTLANDFATLAQDSRMFVSSQNQIGDSISGTGEAFGQTAINAVFSLTDAVYVMPSSQREQVAPVIPPIVLFLIDLAAISVALVVFVGVLLKFKDSFKKRSVLGAWIALLFVFLFILGVGSVGMFVLIDQSAKSGNLEDFTNVITNSNAVYVAIDKQGASTQVISSMQGCAKNITGQVKSEWANKTSSTFEFSGTSCKMDGKTMTFDECLQRVGPNPVIYMQYNSTTSDPKFYVVYQKKAQISGDSAYFERCEIGDVLH
ncbi:MAG: hypothetical protein WC492_05020 [Candidatus Micrarchaeia archaeon]